MEISQASTSVGFTQQGTVDWTALSSTSFSATLSILGRLSSHGLEPLTVAIAQAMFSQIPIGIHGERVLKKSLSTLRSFSSFGDVVWFGVGVRHILRVLVQTSQGSSSVALAACLTESHSRSYSARVFYEMAKLMDSPTDLSPSFDQWEQYVGVCSGVLSDTHFAQAVGQVARVAGFTVPLTQLDDARNRVSDPRCLAEVIISLGKINRGILERFDIIGGLECCWVTTVCDLLGLRVQTMSPSGATVFQNYDPAQTQVQVNIQLMYNFHPGIYRASQTLVLGPMEFVSRWHAEGNASDSHLLDAKISLSSLIYECFGDILGHEALKSGNLRQCFTRRIHFARVLAMCAGIFAAHFRTKTRYQSPKDFVEGAVGVLPELEALKDDALHLLQTWEDDSRTLQIRKSPIQLYLETLLGDDDFTKLSWAAPALAQMKIWLEWKKNGGANWPSTLENTFSNVVKGVQRDCDCGHHPFRCTTFNSMLTPVILAYLLGEIICEDSLDVSRLGVRTLYETLLEKRIPGSFGSMQAYLHLSSNSDASGQELPYYFADRFELLLQVFSGYKPSRQFAPQIAPKVSALSNHGLYCYVDHLREPLLTYEDACRIHIGRGSICSTNRTYKYVLDQDDERLLRPNRSAVIPTEVSVRALVEEGVTLRFWYEKWGSAGPGPQIRYPANPMASLTVGWSGCSGAWMGGNTWLPDLPTSYTKGTAFGEGAGLMVVPEHPVRVPSKDSSAPSKSTQPARRLCRLCKKPGHNARSCPSKA